MPSSTAHVDAVIASAPNHTPNGCALCAQNGASPTAGGFYLDGAHRDTFVAVLRSGRQPMGLTPREYRVLELLREHPDWSNADLASHLGLSTETVKTHLRNARRRLSSRGGRLDVIGRAERLGVFGDGV